MGQETELPPIPSTQKSSLQTWGIFQRFPPPPLRIWYLHTERSHHYWICSGQEIRPSLQSGGLGCFPLPKFPERQKNNACALAPGYANLCAEIQAGHQLGAEAGHDRDLQDPQTPHHHRGSDEGVTTQQV